jgi:hypothetical protein
MPLLRMLKGNYREVLENDPFYALVSPEVFTKDSEEITNEILKDLNRQHFLASNGRQFEDFITSWMSPHTSKSYTQGNMTAGFYQVILQFYPLANSEAFCKKYGIADPFEYMRQKKRSYDFAFYDDEGIPCGISISYCDAHNTEDQHSNLWTVAVIRNTIAQPEDRQVLIISPEEIVKSGAGNSSSTNEAENSFKDALNSQKVAKMFENLFLKNGAINLQTIRNLKSPISIAEDPIQNKKTNEPRLPVAENLVAPVIGTSELLCELNKQYLEVKDWIFNEQDLEIIKAELKEKQRANIIQAHQWYENELLSLYRKRVSDFHQPELDRQLEQSWAKRNAIPAFFGTAGLTGSLGLAFTATNILASLRTTLTGIAFLASGIGTTTASLSILASALVIRQKEQKLTEYSQALSDLEARTYSDALMSYQRKLQEINPKINLSDLPTNKPVTLEQIQNVTEDLEITPDMQNSEEFHRRAILGAKFTSTEFTNLKSKLSTAMPKPNEIEDEFALMSEMLQDIAGPSDLLKKASGLIKNIAEPKATFTQLPALDSKEIQENEIKILILN